LFGGGGGKEGKLGKGDPFVVVVGYTGGVGTALTKAMKAIGLKPYALVSGSKGMSIEGAKSVDTDWGVLNKQLLEAAKEKGGIPIVADVTASGPVQELYETWLKEGITVVAANKGIFAGPEAKYEALLAAAAAEPKARLLHECTVGAGLPVLSTIKGLVESSNKVEKIEGVLSGTLAYVLGEVAGGKVKFSDAVKKGKELGYTEPDPREDLGGMDVARKAVILSRVAGLKGIELTKMNIESLVPEPLRDCSVEDFMNGLSKFDDDFAKKVAAYEAKGERLHYAGAVDMKKKKVIVGPLGCGDGHPFNNAGPDNLVSITTNFYPRPLVVQGAGAGGDVTATGVLADIMMAKNQPL
jgi:homoserine dehydrogenase